MLVILVLFCGLVAKVVVPTLGAILIFAAIGSLKPAEVATIWRCRCCCSGLQPDLTERLRRTGSVQGPVRAFQATPVVGESTHTAFLDAEAWLVKKHDGLDSPEAVSDGVPGHDTPRPGPGEPSAS